MAAAAAAMASNSGGHHLRHGGSLGGLSPPGHHQMYCPTPVTVGGGSGGSSLFTIDNILAPRPVLASGLTSGLPQACLRPPPTSDVPMCLPYTAAFSPAAQDFLGKY